jgi:DDE superfamily endonuclease
MILPKPLAAVLLPFAPVFSAPTFERFVLLALAALLTSGRRTVANLLRTLATLAPGHRCSYQRVLSSARWSALALACRLARLVLALLPTDRPIVLVGDDTVDGHKGTHVWGKARHRDPVRSSHSYTAWRWGHKWVVLAVLVHFPFARRPWALPVLIDLYRSVQDNRNEGRTHRTPAQLLCRLVAVLLRWFPDRRFILVGDAGYGTHEVARFCQTRRDRLALVSKLHPEANLFAPPPPYQGQGRPRVKGAALPKPSQVVAQLRRLRRAVVRWYGGGTRLVSLVSRTGHWYKSGQGLVPLRWVFVRDSSGTHRDEYFYSTDPSLSPEAIIGLYAWRWNVETTFQEARAYLGLESTRGWCRKTVQRAAPCLLGLYSVVAVLFCGLDEAQRRGLVCWPGKETVTFSDALTAVRRWLWQHWVFPKVGAGTVVQQLPPALQTLLFTALAPAA